MRFPPGWSDWCALEDALADGQIGTGPGAYVIRFRAKPITRAVGVDRDGILDIGESGRLRARIRKFRLCAGGTDVRGHMAGWRYAYLGFAKHFALERLDVRWRNVPTKADAYREEGKLLADYVAVHFELPPLNYKFNWPE